MMCFRLKSSPPKKTLRLRCFFFMAPVPGLNREAAPRTNQFIRVFRRSRKQRERVLRWPGQEGRRVPADPGLVACAEIGGERIGALAPRHVENALLLVSRGDDVRSQIEPLAQGRVWLGDQAKERGLVDVLGGLDTAIDLVKQKAKIPAAEHVSLVMYPSRRSIVDVLLRRGTDDPLQARLAQVFGRVPFHAWMKGGMLRVMPYWVTAK